MRDYIVLRDLSRPTTQGPFDADRRRIRIGIQQALPDEPRLETARLDTSEVRDLVRDPNVRAVAPTMPTKLITPLDVPAVSGSTTAWGIPAVGADKTTRTGAGVTVALLDTG